MVTRPTLGYYCFMKIPESFLQRLEFLLWCDAASSVFQEHFFFFSFHWKWLFAGKCTHVLMSLFSSSFSPQDKHTWILPYINTFGHSCYFPESDCIIFKSFGPVLSVPESLFLSKHRIINDNISESDTVHEYFYANVCEYYTKAIIC